MGIKFPTPWKTLIIKFPPPRDGKGVKCRGYAQGGGGGVKASIWLIHKQNSFIWFWKNFTCSPLHPPKCSHACEKFRILAIASIMHVKFEVHMHDKVVSHVWKHFTCNKKFTHITNNFHMYYKISHVCQKVYMHVKCWCGELVFLPTLISHGYFFPHTFYTLFTLFSHT